MQTLLNKVTSIEEEAKDKIRRAEESGQKELNDLLAGEDEALVNVRTGAERRAAHIVQESIDKVSNEVNALRQQGESSIKTIHAVANEKREVTLKQAWELLKQENLI